jgi:hypothetical protein
MTVKCTLIMTLFRLFLSRFLYEVCMRFEKISEFLFLEEHIVKNIRKIKKNVGYFLDTGMINMKWHNICLDHYFQRRVFERAMMWPSLFFIIIVDMIDYIWTCGDSVFFIISSPFCPSVQHLHFWAFVYRKVSAVVIRCLPSMEKHKNERIFEFIRFCFLFLQQIWWSERNLFWIFIFLLFL